MVKPDLSTALAKLDWANNQINVLDAETRLFLAGNPYRMVEDHHPDLSGRVFKIELTKPIPVSIATNCGMIIQAIHNSLDYLAVALAKHNGAMKTGDVYFPITKSREGFFDPKGGQKKIKRLSSEHREIIASFEPYQGGNQTLYAIHSLNNKSKHNDLVAIATGVSGFGFTGNCFVKTISVFQPDNSFYPGQSFLVFDIDGDIHFNVSADIAFHEAFLSGKPFIETLHSFSSLANSIIMTFG